MNTTLRTTILLALLSGLFLTVGYAIGGNSGATVALVVAVVVNAVSYFYSDKIVLSLHQAKKMSPSSELQKELHALAQRANMPTPKLYTFTSPEPNAFATGRNQENGVIAVSSGLLKQLHNDEVRGVLAHELAHIKNRDMLLTSIAATFAAAISYLGNLLFFLPTSNSDEDSNPAAALFLMIVSPVVATIIQLSVSRTREYLADETGAAIAGSPTGLATALAKIDAFYRNTPNSKNVERNATAHLYIASPLSAGSLSGLFSTHPPVKERIKRLQSMTY
ncbi:M48 family metalloprotease [Candidatus Woesebacteria bacterium]|nr:M48 family metalloprotease [Candidatus Woesebacteria bacterium]